MLCGGRPPRPPLLNLLSKSFPPICLCSSERGGLCTPELLRLPLLIQLVEKVLARYPGGRRGCRNGGTLGAHGLNMPCRCQQAGQLLP